LLLLLTFATPLLAEEDRASTEEDQRALTFFESKVRPALVRYCYECHSAEEGTAEGELRLDSRNAIRKGGSRGPAIVPRRPDASLLLTAVSHTDTDLKMPPKSRLPDAVIADLRKWIEMGAPDPRTNDVADGDNTWPGLKAAREHWAYQPSVAAAPPDIKARSWPRDEVDRFVLAALEANGMSPSRDATPEVLLRRLHFDLVGLPPSLPALETFLASCEQRGVDAALAAEVDELLQSPQFGERWGRHWLDVARFAESSGGESNISFPHAWRFRDYVIDAVNADVPYDRFLTEQIAGDLLPYDNDAERGRLLIATGFLAVGTKSMGENNEEQFEADLVDEQIDSLTRAVMSSSVACARCHHHKYEPFRMHDYYALAGIFRSTKTFFGTHTSPANIRSGDPLPLPRVEGQQIFHASLTPKRFDELKAQFAELEAEWAEIEAGRRAAFAGKKPERTFTLREVLANIWRRGPIEGKLETVDDQGNALPLAMGVLDRDAIVDAPLLARGEIGRPGQVVPRAFPQSIQVDVSMSIPDGQSGRLELARWLTDSRHPLTSRVLVNRVWHHLFGTGLVSTVDNFGTTGAKPSHPKLLDTLAVEFVENGWSLKRLVRRLVLTRTWRQASTYDPDAFQRDPENRLRWRMPKRRLEAEAIRDAMLSASGELDLSRPGGSLVARVIGDKPISLIGLDKRLPTDLDGATHRSVYLPVIRDRLPDVLELFDFAAPSLVTGKRDKTNVPVQALYLMNSPFVQARANALASRLASESTSDARLRLAFRLCFSRAPDAAELQRGLDFLGQLDDTADQQRDEHAVLASFCQALLSTAEFRNLD
jgi:hypothetical protein